MKIKDLYNKLPKVALLGSYWLGLLLSLASLSCRSDEVVVQRDEVMLSLPGWQENVIAQQLNVTQYLSQDSDISVRFFYKALDPEKSRAEIRTPLLPDTVFYARAANAAGETVAQTAPQDTVRPVATTAAKPKQGFFFLMELHEVGIRLQIEGSELELRYQLSGRLALHHKKPKDAYFDLERLSDLRLGELLSIEVLDDAPAEAQAAASGEVAETQEVAEQKAEQSERREELLALVRQYLDDIDLFTVQIFTHRQNAQHQNKATAETGQLAPDTSSETSLVELHSAPVLPLVQNQLDDVLAVYFFPETLNLRQQQLVPGKYRHTLEKQYHIVWSAGSQTSDDRDGQPEYIWSVAYSSAIFGDEKFQRLRNSGQLWVRYQNFKSALQVLYNLRYVPGVAIPKSHQLQKKQAQSASREPANSPATTGASKPGY